MAEESPRLESGEDSEGEEEEEGEEAAQAPVLEDKKKATPESEDSTDEAAATPEPSPPPPEEEEAAPSSTAPRPLLPTPAALHPTVPAHCTPAAPAFPSTTTGVNVFANDGSFLELFKKKMEQSPAGSKEEAATTTPEEKKPEPDKRKPISFRDSERLQGLV